MGGEDEEWVEVVRRNRGKAVVQTPDTTQHFVEFSHSFHTERKFFKVLKKKQGRICMSEITSKREFKMEFIVKEIFWLSRASNQVVDEVEGRVLKATRRKWSSVILDVISNERGRALKFGEDRAFMFCIDFGDKEQAMADINQNKGEMISEFVKWRSEIH
ncbi:hypothetical protein Syun_022661 [Stephania yunnanensis]|uniref:Uncharacterized protein n=1 Tax=Stephania yunnanensis TaxID=152371 RepID=A0AAP0I2Z8_9MAGN